MLDRLPQYIDPLNLADRGSMLKGALSLRDFGRISEMLFDTEGAVLVDLYFSREGRLAKIEGEIVARLQLVCQNCLKALDWPVETAVHLGVVDSLEQVDRLPPNFEPLFVEEEKIPLKDIIEDELLLILPQYPKHPHSCPDQDTGSLAASHFSTERQQKRQDNPFSILTNLKNLESPHGSTKK